MTNKTHNHSDTDCCNPEASRDFRANRLRKLGLNLNNWNYVVALAGNPNTGKSTVFNSLTGLRQHTGNWPGKTINRAEGGFEFEQEQYKLVDLPGTYSLLSASDDEEIARNFVLFGQPDVTVVVVDATRLQRNLNLLLQILEITPRVVVCLNLMDEAKRKGIRVDVEQLAEELGIPVVPTVARYGKGLEDLLSAIADVAERKDPTGDRQSLTLDDPELAKAVDELQHDLTELYPKLPNTRWIALRLLDGDKRIEEALASGDLAGLMERFNRPPVDLARELEQINKAMEVNHV